MTPPLLPAQRARSRNGSEVSSNQPILLPIRPAATPIDTSRDSFRGRNKIRQRTRRKTTRRKTTRRKTQDDKFATAITPYGANGESVCRLTYAMAVGPATSPSGQSHGFRAAADMEFGVDVSELADFRHVNSGTNQWLSHAAPTFLRLGRADFSENTAMDVCFSVPAAEAESPYGGISDKP